MSSTYNLWLTLTTTLISRWKKYAQQVWEALAQLWAIAKTEEAVLPGVRNGPIVKGWGL